MTYEPFLTVDLLSGKPLVGPHSRYSGPGARSNLPNSPMQSVMQKPRFWVGVESAGHTALSCCWLTSNLWLVLQEPRF